MNFSRRIKNVLQHDDKIKLKRQAPRENQSDKLEIRISTSVLDIRCEEYRELFSVEKVEADSFHPYFHFSVYEEGDLLCSVTLSGDTQFSNINFINCTSALVFFNIKDNIYMDVSHANNVHEVKKMFCSSKLYIKDWHADLYDVLGHEKSEILFFNGSKFFSLLPEKIIFSEVNKANYFHLSDLKKEQTRCSLCGLKEYNFIIDDNPIIPKKKNKVCKRCLKIIEKNPTH